MTELLYPKLSYQIIGILFEIQNKLGAGLREQDYQRAIAEILKKLNIPLKQQAFVMLKLGDTMARRLYVDFIIADRVVLEIKAQERFLKQNLEQVRAYLKASNLKLGILANFTKSGVMFKRIVNLY